MAGAGDWKMRSTLKSPVWNHVYHFLLPHRLQLAVYLVATVFASALELLAPWPMKIIVDSVLGPLPLPLSQGSDWLLSISQNKILLLAVAIAVGLVLKASIALLRFFSAAISVRMRQHIVLRLKADLFDRFQRQSLSYYDKRRLGDLVSRINNDVWGIDEGILTIMPLLVAVGTLGGMFSIVAYLNWQLALASLIVVPLYYATYGFYSKHFDQRTEEVARMEGESMSIVQEVLSSLRIVKAFTREEHEHNRFLRQGQNAANARIALTYRQVAYSNVVGLITAAGTAVVLGVGAYQVLHNQLTMGEFFVILAYLSSVYTPLEAISTAATYTHGYIAKLKRVVEVLDAPIDIQDKPGALPLKKFDGVVEFVNLSFSYPDRGHVLQNISFSVRPGEAIGIVGPTGSGKTTLVSLIPRFYDPQSGCVAIDGVDMRDLQIKSVRQQISMVSQEAILFWGTIAENISYGRVDASMEEIVEAARLAEAHEFIQGLPEGYNTHIGERGLTLSGGEKQRLSIARAFLKNAPILILDEPTSALDARTESALLEAIWRLVRGRTTFIIAHRLSTIRGVDKILVLDRGRIVEQGEHSKLMSLEGLYSKLYRQQMEYDRYRTIGQVNMATGAGGGV
jgi:ABC-type multidrug transport system fused ATPase/permease subunit